MDLNSFLATEINKIKSNRLLRELTVLDYPAGKEVLIGDKKYLNLCSNNYLCYADHPEIKQAAVEAINRYGAGSTGSRLITGTSPLHKLLEEKLAEFKTAADAMYLSSGYVANVSTIAALLDNNDVVFSDELNHASIIDGIKLSKANKFIYKHNDLANLLELLENHRAKYEKAMIVTDSIFSMDGDRALLKELVELKEQYNCFIMIDEAHATGIIGNTGAGLAQEFGLTARIDIQMGTLSKALGLEGAYIAGSKDLITFLKHKSRGFVFSTAPSPAMAGAVLKAVEIVTKDKQSRQSLWDNINYFKDNLFRLEYAHKLELIQNNSPIFCLIVGNIEQTINFQNLILEDYNIFTKAIRPPTVKTSRIRLCLNSQLTTTELDYVSNAINAILKKIR